MAESSKEAGVVQALVTRLETQRLPRALALKERVDRGELLSEFDIAFLEEVFEDAKNVKPYLDRNPEWQPLAARMLSLYSEIIQKGLENEKASAGERP